MQHYTSTVAFWLRPTRSCACCGSGWSMNIHAVYLCCIASDAPQQLRYIPSILYVSFSDCYIPSSSRLSSLLQLMSKPFQPFHTPQRPEKPSPHDKREPLPRRRKAEEALDSTADSAGSSCGTGLREPLPRLRGRSIGDDGACSAPLRSPLPRLRTQETSNAAGSSTDGTSPRKKPRQKSRPQPKRKQPQLHPPTKAADLDKVYIIQQSVNTTPTQTSTTSVKADASAEDFDETSDEGQVDEARDNGAWKNLHQLRTQLWGPTRQPNPNSGRGLCRLKNLTELVTRRPRIHWRSDRLRARPSRGKYGAHCANVFAFSPTLAPPAPTRRVKTTGGVSKTGPRIPPAALPLHAGAFDRLDGCDAVDESLAQDTSFDWTVVTGVPTLNTDEVHQTDNTHIPAPPDDPADVVDSQGARHHATRDARIRWQREAFAQRVALIKARALAFPTDLPRKAQMRHTRAYPSCSCIAVSFSVQVTLSVQHYQTLRAAGYAYSPGHWRRCHLMRHLFFRRLSCKMPPLHFFQFARSRIILLVEPRTVPSPWPMSGVI